MGRLPGKMSLHVVVLLSTLLALVGANQNIQTLCTNLLLANVYEIQSHCLQNTYFGDKVLNASTQCGISLDSAVSGRRASLNRAETQCHPYANLENYVDQLACFLGAMGWLDTSGKWVFNAGTSADFDSIPNGVMDGVSWGNVWKCTRRKMREYSESMLNWNSCKGEYTRKQRKTIRRALKYASRLECMGTMLTDQCCVYYQAGSGSWSGSGSGFTSTGTGSGTITSTGTGSGTIFSTGTGSGIFTSDFTGM